MSAIAPKLPMAQIEELCRRYHVRELSLFGSRARGDERPDSDYDFLVSFDPESKSSLFHQVELKQELEALLARSVDVVVREGLRNPYRKASILKDARLVYGRG